MGFGALKRRGVRINRGQGRSGGMGRMGPRAPLLPRTRIWSLTFSRKTSPMGARPGAAPRCGGGKVRASAFAKCPLPLKAHLRLRFRTARGDRQVAKRGGRRTLPPSLRMPEGPELHLASQFVNEACRALVFGGCVEKSSVSRNPEVPFESSAYRISASARGKELRLILSPLPGAQPPQEPLALVFRFGMSGSFQLVPREELPRHAHLRFYTAPSGPRLALCFVDIRRFGRWELGGKWQPGRGPCVLQEYQQFRENVLRNLADKAFDRPICEALLDQRFFNGIGNYLRAEILYRLKIPPFEKARSVLEALQQRRPSPELTLSQKIRTKLQNPDLLELCHSVPKEVVQLGRKSRKKKSKATEPSPEDRVEDPSPPSKAPSRTRRAKRDLPKRTATQRPEGTSLQQDPEAPTVPKKGRRKGRQAASGHRRPRKVKADTPSLEPEETSAS
ncbi:endonuclease 8-like 1 isoform X6 [Nomascus leucogenys]|uniref:endonuclease 8-like 1 isoform X6 n=1 Tax=Nomascus leucogenys TaxID=61853 RepID=UPI00122D5D0B|nr:endonuclease 8-like 1 isoform X6 [Nomascus leucogenys]